MVIPWKLMSNQYPLIPPSFADVGYQCHTRNKNVQSTQWLATLSEASPDETYSQKKLSPEFAFRGTGEASSLDPDNQKVNYNLKYGNHIGPH